jgi:hypothetical protein
MSNRLQHAFALLALTSTVACGDASSEGDDAPSSVRSASTHGDEPGEFLGFAPSEGVTETPITLEFSMAHACRDAACTVTIDGIEAPFVDETRAAVRVPRHAKSGDICVSSGSDTACVPGLTVLDRPRVDAVAVVHGPSGPGLLVSGAGFPQDAVIIVGYERIDTHFVSPAELTGVVPKSLAAGVVDVTVLAPSHRRCGAPSDPFTISLGLSVE